MLAIIKTIFCFSILAISNFVSIPLLEYQAAVDSFTVYNYNLLYITCFVLSLLFKNNFAFIALVIYLVAGLAGLPLFAYGGGIGYVFEPSFGYLLGLILVSMFAFYYKYHHSYPGTEPVEGASFFKPKNIAPIFGILLAHLLGLLYMLVTGHFSMDNFLNMSLYQLVYDCIFAYLVLLI